MLGARGGYFFCLVRNFFFKKKSIFKLFLFLHIESHVYVVFMYGLKVYEKVSMLVFSFDYLDKA